MKDKMKNILPGFLILLISGIVILPHCSRETLQIHGDVAEDGHGHDEEIVLLSDEEINEFGIKISTAKSGKLKRHVDLTGEIVINPDRLAHIHPRFPGIVKDVRKKIGDNVERGDVLAIIESNESLAPYEVKSLITGKVIDMHLTLGEVVADDSHTFTIADLSKVWANFSVYQKDLPYIRPGQPVYISTGLNREEVLGHISYISPVIDEKTRTATVRVELDNHTGNWRPGLFVNGRVVVSDERVPVYVPKTALEYYENQTVVFVRHGDGFRPQPVNIGRSDTQGVEIVAGLKPGQQYISKGGFTLKAELQKEAFGDGHGH